MSDSIVGEKIVINGEQVKAQEIFRASGVRWVRYKCTDRRLNQDSQYITEPEWVKRMDKS